VAENSLLDTNVGQNIEPMQEGHRHEGL